MRQGKTTGEIAKIVGISPRNVAARLSRTNISNFQQHQQQKHTDVNRRSQIQIDVDDASSAEDVAEAATFAAEVPPAEEHQRSFLDRAAAKLGLAPEKNVEPHAEVQSRKLTTGQHEFVTLATPIARQVAISGSKQLWNKIAGEEKAPFLVPSKDDADSIMVPLCRALARTVSIELKGKVTPNQIDIAASLAAVAAYAGASWELYSKMKKEEARYGTFYPQEEARNGARPIQPRSHYAGGAVVADRQAGYAAASPEPVRSAPVEAVPAGPVAGEAGRHSYPGQSAGPDLSSLTESERRAYEKLRSLSARDYESRRRRSGISAGI